MQISQTLSELRARTRALHDAAERAMNIMSDDLKAATYAAKLATMHSLFKQMASVIGGEKLDGALARIERDLGHFAGGPKITAPVGEDFLENLRDPAYRDGAFYVIDGSALGGQFVAKHLERLLGLTPEKGAAYFYGDGPKTQEIWRAKIARLGDYDANPVARARVIDGAEETFRVFIRIFS